MAMKDFATKGEGGLGGRKGGLATGGVEVGQTTLRFGTGSKLI